MQNSLAKKIFAVGSAVAMTMALVAPFVASAADAPGTNIVDASGTVWMITSNNTLRAYTSAGAFLSYGFNSWSQVVPASAADLALPKDPAGFIPPQDGSIICSDRGADQGTCYEISAGQKYGFTSAAVFTGLGFSFSNALSGDVSWMSAGSMLVNSVSMAHLPGTLVNNKGTVQLVGSNGLLGIPDLNTFNSWGYSFSKVVPANAYDQAMIQTGVMAVRQPAQLSPTALAMTNPSNPSNPSSPVISGNVGATLSSDTPAAGTLVANSNGTSPGQTQADLANFTFSGTGTVTQVVVNRIGVSADNTIANVYLYQGNDRLTSAGSFSNGMVTFSNSNGLFTVTGSTEISVRVDVAAGSGLSGQTVGAQLASFAVANGTPMTTSISGNLFQIAAVSNLATAQLTGTSTTNSGITSSGSSNGSNSGTINAGTMNAILWQAPISIGQRTVLLKHVAFTQIGSIQSTAINSYQLYVDGSVAPVSATVTSAGGQTQIVFDMPSNPVSLGTGSHTLSLEGNIVGGTSFTFEYSVQTAADISLFDTNYDVNVPLTYSNGSAIFQVAPGLTTISSGTVSVQTDPAFSATQFVANSSGVVLGQWDLTAYGENVNVNQLQVKLAYTGTMTSGIDGFNNLTILVNGGSVGSSQSALAGANGCGTGSSISCTFTFGTTNLFTINAGQTVVVQIKGDSVINATDITAVQASLITPTNSLQGQTSYALSGTGQVYSATTLSTGASTGTLTKNSSYSNQTVSSNLASQEIGSYVIQAGSIDGIRLNQVTVGLNGSFGSTSVTNALTGLYVSVSYPSGSASTTPVNPQSSNTFTLNNVTIPANQSATVNVFANIGNFTGSASTTLYGTGQGLTSNQSLSNTGFTSATAVVGQNITVGNGTLNSVILNSADSPQASYVASLTANQPVATYNFYATSTAGITITELGFTTGNANGAIAAVTVGGITSQVNGSSSLVSGLNIAVPFGTQGLSVPVTATFNKTGSNGITGGDQAVTLTLAHVKYIAGGSTTSYSTTGWNTIKGTSDATTTVGTLGINAPATFLVGAYPDLSVTSANNGSLTTSQQHLIDATVGPNSSGGSLQVNQIAFTVSQSGITSGPSLSSTLLGVNGSNTAINGSSCLVNGSASSSLASAVTVTCTLPANYNISNPVTFSLFGTITGTLGSAGQSSVTASLAAANTLAWTDITGDNSSFGTGGTYSTANATYLQNYPTSTWYIHN